LPQLDAFFNPKSIAIVGASRDETKVGHKIIDNILVGGYPGKVFPINPNAADIDGLRCYPDLASIGETPELVIIVVPSRLVPEVMKQSAAAGVHAVIIITAGFKEIGAAGAELEREVSQIAKHAGIRVLGPNCLGVIAPGNKLNASFGGNLPAVGNIGYVSQSGALLAAILDMASANGIGFSKLVSIGNKADIDELAVIAALSADAQTRVIAGYLESITDGNAFMREAERTSTEKPILLIKAGGTEAGSRAASSHTGSLAGGEVAYEAVFARAGIVRCESIKAQFDYALAFATQPLPKGNRVAVLTNAGGPGIMAADEIERQDLVFAKLAESTQNTLAAQLPPAANVHNPIDVLGDALADRYEAALQTILDDPNTDMVLILLTPQAMTECTETAKAIIRVSTQKPEKPILTCFMGGTRTREAITLLNEADIPTYDSPESAVRVIKVMTDYVRWQARPKRVVKLFPANRRRVEAIVERRLRQGASELSEAESKEILEAYGFVTPRGQIASTAEQAADIALQLGFPVVLKIWSPDITHKSDVDGVKLGLDSVQQVKDAFDLMMYRIPMQRPEATILGVLVQEMCGKGQEVILGMHRDHAFGPLMMFGMGGILVEVLKDVSFYLAPLTADEAKQMLISTRTYRLLQGVRGKEGVDLDALAESLQRLSQLATEFTQIQELDINPFVMGPPGVTPIAVDARMRIAQETKERK
jgi:acetyltransferase